MVRSCVLFVRCSIPPREPGRSGISARPTDEIMIRIECHVLVTAAANFENTHHFFRFIHEVMSIPDAGRKSRCHPGPEYTPVVSRNQGWAAGQHIDELVLVRVPVSEGTGRSGWKFQNVHTKTAHPQDIRQTPPAALSDLRTQDGRIGTALPWFHLGRIDHDELAFVTQICCSSESPSGAGGRRRRDAPAIRSAPSPYAYGHRSPSIATPCQGRK